MTLDKEPIVNVYRADEGAVLRDVLNRISDLKKEVKELAQKDKELAQKDKEQAQEDKILWQWQLRTQVQRAILTIILNAARREFALIGMDTLAKLENVLRYDSELRTKSYQLIDKYMPPHLLALYKTAVAEKRQISKSAQTQPRAHPIVLQKDARPYLQLKGLDNDSVETFFALSDDNLNQLFPTSVLDEF